jgi:hypothetical protein
MDAAVTVRSDARPAPDIVAAKAVVGQAGTKENVMPMLTIRCMAAAATVLVVVMSAPAFVKAESNAPVVAGSTVRVRLVEPKFGSLQTPKTREGVLISLTETEIGLEATAGRPPLLLARAGIERYEKKTRVGRRTAGALWGAGIGAVTGLVYGVAVVGNTEDDPTDLFHLTALENGVFGAALLVLPGAAIGALISPGEKWQEFDPAGVHISCVVGDGGAMGLRVTRRF